MLEKLLQISWYGPFQWTRIFWPLMWLFSYVANKKRKEYLASKAEKIETAEQTGQVKVPVIVVGNITVGGTGKTPVVQSLVAELKAIGLKAGIISRGYGGQCESYPHLITQNDTPAQVGDEPLMLSQSLNIPVVVDPKRKQALELMLKQVVDVVISDDGMQHYALDRQMEICVLDAQRGLGNGKLLPVGPLREPTTRLLDVDFALYNLGSHSESESKQALPQHGSYFSVEPVSWVNVKTGETKSLEDFRSEFAEVLKGQDVVAIAGIGNPQKFFDSCAALNINVPTKPYPDHYAYSENDIANWPKLILMTQKDAVKIASLPSLNSQAGNMWYLAIQAKLDSNFIAEFKTQLKQLIN